MKSKSNRLWYECVMCGYAIDWFDMAQNGKGKYSQKYCAECYKGIHSKRMSVYFKTDKGKSYKKKLSTYRSL